MNSFASKQKKYSLLSQMFMFVIDFIWTFRCLSLMFNNSKTVLCFHNN